MLDPFALFDNPLWISILKNHICIQAVQIGLQPYTNVEAASREYIKHKDVIELAYMAGLEMDTPNLRDEFGFENIERDIDRSFTFNETDNTILWVFRFAEEGVDREQAAKQTEDMIDLTTLGEAELQATVEERVFVKLLLKVHPSDADKVRKEYSTKVSNFFRRKKFDTHCFSPIGKNRFRQRSSASMSRSRSGSSSGARRLEMCASKSSCTFLCK